MGANDMIWWAADRSREQVGDAFLENRIGLETDSVFVALGLQEVVDIRCGEGGITAEVTPQFAVPISGDDGLQKAAPAVGAVDVAGTKRGPFQIAELIEHKQRMVAGAGEVAVVGGTFLIAVGRAEAG